MKIFEDFVHEQEVRSKIKGLLVWNSKYCRRNQYNLSNLFYVVITFFLEFEALRYSLLLFQKVWCANNIIFVILFEFL